LAPPIPLKPLKSYSGTDGTRTDRPPRLESL
jgi:hypothetical protein